MTILLPKKLNLILILSVFILPFRPAYALPPKYVAHSAEEKQAYLWGEIVRTIYPELPQVKPGFFESLQLFFPSYLHDGFKISTDEMPARNQKLIHPFGSVALVEFNIRPHSSHYTGIFQSGGIGLMRLSLFTSAPPFRPSLALKILVDGQPSVNFHASISPKKEQKPRNFFDYPFSNYLSRPRSCSLNPREKIFKHSVRTLSHNPSLRPAHEHFLPLFEACKMRSSGSQVQNPLEPAVVSFIPIRENIPNEILTASGTLAVNLTNDFRILLMGIPVNTTLFQVAVKKNLLAKEEVIGDITIRSPFIASEYGDHQLSFQHQSMRRIGATYTTPQIEALFADDNLPNEEPCLVEDPCPLPEPPLTEVPVQPDPVESATQDVQDAQDTQPESEKTKELLPPKEPESQFTLLADYFSIPRTQLEPLPETDSETDSEMEEIQLNSDSDADWEAIDLLGH